MLNSKMSLTQSESMSHEIQNENLVPEKFENSSESSDVENQIDAKSYGKYFNFINFRVLVADLLSGK